MFFDPENAEKQRALERTSILERINARPPRPFQVKDFERLCLSSSDELLAALFKMLEEHLLARPADTADVDGKAGDWSTTAMHSKKHYLERYVFPLLLWTIEDDVISQKNIICFLASREITKNALYFSTKKSKIQKIKLHFV